MRMEEVETPSASISSPNPPQPVSYTLHIHTKSLILAYFGKVYHYFTHTCSGICGRCSRCFERCDDNFSRSGSNSRRARRRAAADFRHSECERLRVVRGERDSLQDGAPEGMQRVPLEFQEVIGAEFVPEGVDVEFLAALPDDMRAEVCCFSLSRIISASRNCQTFLESYTPWSVMAEKTP